MFLGRQGSTVPPNFPATAARAALGAAADKIGSPAARSRGGYRPPLVFPFCAANFEAGYYDFDAYRALCKSCGATDPVPNEYVPGLADLEPDLEPDLDLDNDASG